MDVLSPKRIVPGAAAVLAAGPVHAQQDDDSLSIAESLEYAQQRRYANGDYRIDANYWRVDAGLASTGWTLYFFNTPRAGLRDRWLPRIRKTWLTISYTY